MVEMKVRVLMLCAVVVLSVDLSSGCNARAWNEMSDREKDIFKCLNGRGWSKPRLVTFYEDYIKGDAKKSHVTREVQWEVSACMTARDFLNHGVTPDGDSPRDTERDRNFKTEATPPSRDQEIYQCMLQRGWNENQIGYFFDQLESVKAHERPSYRVPAKIQGCMNGEDFLREGLLLRGSIVSPLGSGSSQPSAGSGGGGRSGGGLPPGPLGSTRDTRPPAG